MVKKGIVVLTLLAGSYALANPPYYGALMMRVPLYGAAWVDPEEDRQVAQAQPPQRQPAPPPPAPAQRPPEDKLDEINRKLDKLIQLLTDEASPEGERGANQPVVPPDFIAALNTCVGCHSPDTAGKKGDGFRVFVEGKGSDGTRRLEFREDFTARELNRMVNRIKDDEMPKKPAAKLTPPQKTAMLEELKARLTKAESSDDRR